MEKPTSKPDRDDHTTVTNATCDQSGAYDRSPYVVFYELTRACDLVCLHCRACAQSNPDPRELNTDQSCALIDQIAEFPRPPILVFTGGDPFKRADVFELIRHAVSRGLETAITPSATPLVTREAVVRMRDAGVMRIAVSLDGADAASHDANRGVAGSYQRTLEIIADARRCGLEVQVNTTLTPRNVDQIERFAELLAEFDIALWSVFFLVPVGRAAEMRGLDAAGCEAAFDRLWRVAQSRRFALKTTEAPHFRRFVAQRQKQAKARARETAGQLRGNSPPCDSIDGNLRDPQTLIRTRPLPTNDGKGILFVSHIGEVFPSGFLPLECGRAPSDHVVTVYQDSPIFRQLRDANQLTGKCGVCEFRNLCGGSRARAFAVTGNPFAEEPDCIYVPPAWAP